MSTQIQAIDKTNVKMRWKEDYVTPGLNRKMLGAVPSGLARGGLLSPGGSQTVNVDPDPKYGDIVAVYGDETNGFQTTVRLTGSQNLDLSALSGQTVYVCLFVDYTQGAETSAEWRAYTQAELDSAAEKDSLVVLGKVTVSSPITAADIEWTERTEQGMKLADSQVPWVPMVPNGNFDAGFDGWEIISGAAADFALETSNPYKGLRSLKFADTTPPCGLIASCRIPVQPGDLLKIHAAFKGTGSAGTSSVKLMLWTDSGTQAALTPVGLEFDESSGTSWEVKEEIIEVPDTVYFVDVIVRHEAGTVAGACVDDVQVYLKSADMAGAPIFSQDCGSRPTKRCGALEFDFKDPITDLSAAERFVMDGQATAGRLALKYEGAVSPPSYEPDVDGAIDLGRSSKRWGEAFLTKLNVSDAASEGVSANLYPDTDDSYELGGSGRRWTDLYSNAAHIDTLTVSDAAGEGVGDHLVPITDKNIDLGNGSYNWGSLFSARVVVTSDLGAASTGELAMTNVTNGATGSGVGTVKMNGTTGYDNAGWLKIYIGSSSFWIPYWLSI